MCVGEYDAQMGGFDTLLRRFMKERIWLKLDCPACSMWCLCTIIPESHAARSAT
jgi:hypothetical protein